MLRLLANAGSALNTLLRSSLFMFLTSVRATLLLGVFKDRCQSVIVYDVVNLLTSFVSAERAVPIDFVYAVDTSAENPHSSAC
jgi:hypothetical protein